MTDFSDLDKISAEFLNTASTSSLVIEKEDEKAFEQFCDLRVSQKTIAVSSFVFFAVTSYMYGMSLVHPKSWYFLSILVGIIHLVRNPLGFLMVLYRWNIKKPNPSPFYLSLAPWFPWIINMLGVFSSFTVSLFLIARVLNGRCEKLDQLHMWSCNSEYDSRALPQEMVFCLMFMPLMFSTTLKTIRTPYIVLTWVINVSSLIIAIAISGATQSIPTLLVYIPLSAIVLYEIHRQNVILFLILKKQKSLLEANKKLSEESQNELRFMIANMAHDLKTVSIRTTFIPLNDLFLQPLSAFMNGVEILTSLVSDGFNKSELSIANALVLTSVKENLVNLHTVNSFMTMTVNRCIDYMKASKGIKLEPRLETINLQEVLSMPLNCMRDLQSRITIRQNPIPVNVCGHIITDLQWFQENLFCLISNAVKYSSHGHISVSVALTPASHPSIVSAKLKKRLVIEPRAKSPDSGEGMLSGRRSSFVEQYTFLDRMNSRVVLTTSQPSDADIESGEAEATTRLHGEAMKPKSPVVKKTLHPKKVYVAPTETSLTARMEESERPMLLVEVEDTGIGLSDEVKETLFTPFKQAQRRAGGTGLGLYSLAKRVDALGGYYGVSNCRDGEQGSIFWFAIPYRPDATPLHRSTTGGVRKLKEQLSTSSLGSCVSSSHLLASGQSSPRRHLRVLLVDDSPTILKMTSNLLKRHGHVVDQEENGADALSRLEKTRNSPSHPPYDVMLIDLNMPVMDGLEAMKRLRELERELNSRQDGNSTDKFHQRVFAFSANSDRETMAEAMAAGADDFICKPFSIQTFNEKVDKSVQE